MKRSNLPSAMRRGATVSGVAAYVGALLLVAISTGVGLLVSRHWGNSPVVLLYLPSVLTAAIYAGLRPGIAAATTSALAYNYFFTAPYRTFLIHDPSDVVTVVILFAVAAVTSHLAASVRQQAELAAAHAARNATIAGFARRLLMAQDEAAVAHETVSEIAGLFTCRAVLVLAGEDQKIAARSVPNVELNPSDHAAAAQTLHSGQVTGRGRPQIRESDWQFHPVEARQTVIGALGLALESGALPVPTEKMPLLRSMLDQAALALERARLDRETREAITLRERYKLRTALLVSISDEVKPRLAAIRAQVRALRRGEAPERSAMVDLAGNVGMIDRYIDSLVDLNPGADIAPLDFGAISIDLHRRVVRKAGEEVHLTPKEFALLGELAKQAGRVLHHTYLLRVVWGPAQQDHIDYLRVAIRNLRSKLEADPASPQLILNEPGVGYRLAVERGRFG